MRPTKKLATLKLARGAGVTSATLGALCVIAELCFRFPHYLVYNDARAFYVKHIEAFRSLLLVSILATFVLGCASVLALRHRGLGAFGLILGVVAVLLGGPSAEAITSQPRPLSAGLDYFILSLLVLALVFVPMERIWPVRPQRVFRPQWQTDIAHFFANHAGVQVLAFLSIVPVQLFFSWAVDNLLQRTVAAQPLWLQLVEIFVVVEISSYWAHRAFHRVPVLWRFHAIHHSVQHMDWLAGSRLHIVDVVVTRLAGFLPVFLLGFSPAAFYGYLIFVSFHAVYIHANINHRWPVLRNVLTTPEFHHWHHAAEAEAVDKNFAVVLSCVDSLFGTAYRPSRWPTSYGLVNGEVPSGYWRQLTFPFRRSSDERRRPTPS